MKEGVKSKENSTDLVILLKSLSSLNKTTWANNNISLFQVYKERNRVPKG